MPQNDDYDDSSDRRRRNVTGQDTGPDALRLSSRPRGNTGRKTNSQSYEDEQFDYEDNYRPQGNTSSRRYPTGSQVPSPHPPTLPITRRSGTQDLPIPGRTSSRITGPRRPITAPKTEPPLLRVTRRASNVHWLLPVGIGMIAMLVLWVFGTLAVAWGQQISDNLTYGNPRTYQTDAVVGHGDSPQHKSHFIAINYNHQAVVTEWMGGNPAKSIVYVVPYTILGDNSNLTPVTVEFRDVNGDHKPDMIIHIHLRTQDQTFVFINDGTKFRTQTSSDKITL